MMDGGELEEKTEGGKASVSGREREMEGCTDGTTRWCVVMVGEN